MVLSGIRFLPNKVHKIHVFIKTGMGRACRILFCVDLNFLPTLLENYIVQDYQVDFKRNLDNTLMTYF